MKKLLLKKRELILYMLFGMLTFLVNVLVYYVMAKINDNTAIDTAVALFASIAVAYTTNRTMVFQSDKHGAKAVIPEFFSFLLCRLISGLMDILIMVIFVDFFHYNDMVVKLVSNVFVIVFNFVASKKIVFKNQ